MYTQIKDNNKNRKNILKIEGINFNRGNMRYANLSMNIDKLATAIIGQNGIGKSSLLEKIAIFSNKDEGNIFFDDICINKLSLNDRAKLIGYLPHSEKPCFDFKVIDFVLLGRYPHHRGYIREEDIEVCMEYMKKLNILYLKDKGVFSLSKGEFQKVCLSRIFSLQPQLLLLDEPFSNLDLNSIQNLLNILELELKKNRMIIASFHDINLVKKFAKDSFILFYDSYIDYTSEINSKNLSNVYGVELKSIEDNYFVF